VLHVIGRTFNSPHKYFYRRYVNEAWTPWEPVDADIDGDHVAAALWRGRLHLFWVKFMDKPQPPEHKGSGGAAKHTVVQQQNLKFTSTLSSQSDLASMTPDELAANLGSPPPKRVDFQLNWIEHSQGGWRTRESSGYGGSAVAPPGAPFDSSGVLIYVTLELEDGQERAVRIHLGAPINQQFRLVSKNSPPVTATNQANPPQLPLSSQGIRATQRTGSGQLLVTFVNRIQTFDNKNVKQDSTSQPILQQGGTYALLACDNPIVVNSSEEIGALLGPVFYHSGNGADTFFIEPRLTEKTFDVWDTWEQSTGGGAMTDPNDFWAKHKGWNLAQAVPAATKPVGPGGPLEFARNIEYARYKLNPTTDWATHPATVLKIGESLIAESGGLNVSVQSATDANAQDVVGVHAGSELGAGERLVLSGAVKPGAATDVAGVTQRGAVVIGGAGLNALQLEHLSR
jgi:hypothetical protein